MTTRGALTTLSALRDRARELGPRRVAVVDADDDVALTAAADARRQGIAEPVLVGDATRIRTRIDALGLGEALAEATVHPSENPADTAAELAGRGAIDVVMKGHVRTDQLLHAVLDRRHGLRTGRLLSDVLLYEDSLSGTRRLVGVTDGGITVAPGIEQKRDIVLNAIEVLHLIGIERPHIALLSATEAVSEGVPSTVDARALAAMAETGVFGDALVFGPLALDNALLEAAARAKGIAHPVAGHADCLVAPNIEAGNILGKAVKYLGGSSCAHVVIGARLPVLIPSRVESAEDKVNAIALGVIVASR